MTYLLTLALLLCAVDGWAGEPIHVEPGGSVLLGERGTYSKDNGQTWQQIPPVDCLAQMETAMRSMEALGPLLKDKTVSVEAFTKETVQTNALWQEARKCWRNP